MGMTIVDVARKAKLSTSTVSLALRGSPLVREETKRRVTEIAREINYRRNALGRVFVLQKTETIGLVATDIENVITTQLIFSVEDAAAQQGYHVIVANTQGQLDKETEYVELLSQGKADALIIGSVKPEHDHITTLKSYNFPFVLLDKCEDEEVSYVALDDEQGAYLAVAHLIRLGHKRIGYVSGPEGILTNRRKIEGYRKAHLDHRLEADESLLVDGGYVQKDGYRAAKEVLQLGKTPSALFCFNDKVALGVIRALKEAECKVPDDVAVVGFDNTEDAEFSDIPLTTVAYPAYEVGKKAVDILFYKLADKEKEVAARYVEEFKPKLVIRESCGARLQ